jgi:hypothetical protein
MKLKEVMMEECYQYRDSEKPQLDAAFNAKQWENCFNMARSKIRISKSCLAPLVRAAKCWSISFKYYDVLATAVSQNPVWEEARVKLNQLLVKRIDEERFLRTTTNPIYLLDPEHLIAWKTRPLLKGEAAEHAHSSTSQLSNQIYQLVMCLTNSGSL